MSIGIQPYDDHGAMVVFSDLDAYDLMEAHLVRGSAMSHLGLFGDWRSMRPAWIESHVLTTRGRPFAVLAIANTGQAGVAQAAFLARNHAKFRRAIAEAAVIMRSDLPILMEDRGIHRIEARCWTGHPTAARFLAAIGFDLECFMTGFGPDGRAGFIQFAATLVPPSPPTGD
jgi:hypothetical protein